MKKSHPCPKCGSGNVVKEVEAVGSFAVGIRLQKSGRPEALFFQENRWSGVLAWVCADCGFIEWYAVEPKKLQQKSEEG